MGDHMNHGGGSMTGGNDSMDIAGTMGDMGHSGTGDVSAHHGGLAYFQNNALPGALLFEFWHPTTDATYAISMVVAVFLGLFQALLIVLRNRLAKRLRRHRLGGKADASGEGVDVRVLAGLAFVTNAGAIVLGYFLMLIAMTFNTGLFISVLTGLSFGYGFVLYDSVANTETSCGKKDCGVELTDVVETSGVDCCTTIV